MSKILKTSRDAEGNIITLQGNIADDFINLTEQKTEATGVLLIGKNENLFIPNDLPDRQAIIEKLDKLCDILDKVNNAIPTMSPDPTATAEIVQLKQELEIIKEELK